MTSNRFEMDSAFKSSARMGQISTWRAMLSDVPACVRQLICRPSGTCSFSDGTQGSRPGLKSAVPLELVFRWASFGAEPKNRFSRKHISALGSTSITRLIPESAVSRRVRVPSPAPTSRSDWLPGVIREITTFSTLRRYGSRFALRSA